jgi:hypothetical protein
LIDEIYLSLSLSSNQTSFFQVIRLLLILLLLKSLIAVHLVFGADELSHELILESKEPIIYEDDNTTITAKGDASLRGKEFLLLADQISWNRTTGEAIAKGAVSLTKNSSRLLADQINLWTETGNFIAKNSKGGTPPKFFIADEIERNGSVETYRNAKVYMSEPGFLEPNFRTRLYASDDNASTFKIASSQLRLGNVLVGVLPGYSGKKRSGLWGLNSVVKIGKDSTLGWYGESSLSYNWEDLTASTKINYYQERGILISPQLKLTQSWENGFSNSQLNGSWVYDQDSQLGRDTRGMFFSRNRGHVHFRNTSRTHDRWRSATLIEWESDSEIIRDFKRSFFYSNQWNQSNSELSYEGNGYTISVFGRWQAHDHESTVEQLPLLNLDFGPRRLPVLGLHQSSTLTYANLTQRNHFGQKKLKFQRLNAGYKLERPIHLIRGLTLTPSAAFLAQNHDLGTNASQTYFDELGLDLHSSLYQSIPYNNETWEISEILHTMNFSVGFRNTERLSGPGSIDIVKVFPVVDDLNLAPLDLLDHRNSEAVFDKKLIRFGWQNLFLGKWDDRSRTLLSMNTFYDMHKRHKRDNSTMDSIYSDISIHPSHWFSLSMRQKTDVKTGKNFRKSYGLNFKDGRFQGASISYLSYLNFNNYSSFSGWKRLNEKLNGSISALYDLDKSFLTYWRGRLEYKTSGSWVWDFSITQRKGTRKENNTEWSVGLSPAGFKSNTQGEPDGLSSIYSM